MTTLTEINWSHALNTPNVPRRLMLKYAAIGSFGALISACKGNGPTNVKERGLAAFAAGTWRVEYSLISDQGHLASTMLLAVEAVGTYEITGWTASEAPSDWAGKWKLEGNQVLVDRTWTFRSGVDTESGSAAGVPEQVESGTRGQLLWRWFDFDPGQHTPLDFSVTEDSVAISLSQQGTSLSINAQRA